MRFFRVNLPKKYRCEDHADELIQTACSMKVILNKEIFIKFILSLLLLDQFKKIKKI